MLLSPDQGGGGTPHPVLIRGYPHPVLLGGGEVTPCQEGWWYPPVRKDGSTPPPVGKDEVPPYQDCMGTPHWQMGVPPPRCGLTHKLKILASAILRMRAVKCSAV